MPAEARRRKGIDSSGRSSLLTEIYRLSPWCSPMRPYRLTRLGTSRDSLSYRLHAVIKEPEKRHFIGISAVRGGARLSAPELNADKTPADVKEVNEMKHSAPTGLVSLMLVAASVIPAAADELTRTRFIQLDANRDGYLTQHEIRTQPESSRWLQISTYGSFTLADVNSDGQVDEAEFSAFEQALPVE